MKKIIISFAVLGIMLVLLHACSKKNISGDSSNLVMGSYITLDSTINGILDVGNSASTVSIKIGKSVGAAVATVNVYAATGSNTEDTSNWKLIKTVTYSDGLVLSVSTAELSQALGANPAPGNKYVLQNQVVTKDGRKFSTSNTPDTYNSFPAYNMALTWYATAVCAFTGNMAGDYYLTKDSWNDYGATAANPVLIPHAVVDGPGANQISIYVYPGAPAGGVETGPMIVNVNPVTGAATIVKSDIGNYGDPSSETTVTGTGFVFDCVGVIDLKINFNYGGTNYASQEMILKKTP
ncbi:MAG TPA: hypothetical protein VHE34_19870 [Puia sp.]|uniref:hypothetical protein n=1 Tax=Puia sp. TaxID=2045100 RepID=UPI002C7125F5|nr:hypothetical protein [Puia sp.]HVU97496.1 hypothetical protein [Puia sp.]